MKTMFKYASLLFVSGALLITSCSKKKDDTVTPDPVVSCIGGSIKTLTYHLDKDHVSGTGTEENASVVVTKCDGSYNIVIDMANDINLDYLYILKSEDGQKATPVKISDVKDNNGFTWTGNSSSYTLKAPSGADKKTFKLTINLPVRTIENGTDAYELWFTTSNTFGNGRFSQPSARRNKGPVNASFVYGSIKYNTTNFTATAGSQGNATLPSYIITTGTGGTLLYTDIVGTAANLNPDSTADFGSVNMLFYVLNSVLDARGTTTPALVSPDKRSALSYTTLVTGGSSTKFELYSNTGSLEITDAALKAVAPSKDMIAIEAGKSYSFMTTYGNGKKSVGLVKVNSIVDNATASANRTANLTFKVLNVSL